MTTLTSQSGVMVEVVNSSDYDRLAEWLEGLGARALKTLGTVENNRLKKSDRARVFVDQLPEQTEYAGLNGDIQR